MRNSVGTSLLFYALDYVFCIAFTVILFFNIHYEIYSYTQKDRIFKSGLFSIKSTEIFFLKISFVEIFKL